MRVPLLSVRDVAVRRCGAAVLDGVSPDLRRGEVASLLGPSGAARSTLFEVLTGGRDPVRGRVLVEGNP